MPETLFQTDTEPFQSGIALMEWGSPGCRQACFSGILIRVFRFSKSDSQTYLIKQVKIRTKNSTFKTCWSYLFHAIPATHSHTELGKVTFYSNNIASSIQQLTLLLGGFWEL